MECPCHGSRQQSAAERRSAPARRRRRRRARTAAAFALVRYPPPPPLSPRAPTPHRPSPRQGQRALKRQKSLPNGDPAFGSPTGGPPPGGYPGGSALAAHGGHAAYTNAADGNWEGKCWGVLNAIYSDIGPKEFCYNLPAKEVFFKTVSETFPGVAPQYYSIVRNPITFRDIEARLTKHEYESAQHFADVSGEIWREGFSRVFEQRGAVWSRRQQQRQQQRRRIQTPI
jgi:hypothetical protein